MNLTIRFFGKVLSLILIIIFFIFIFFINSLYDKVGEASINANNIIKLEYRTLYDHTDKLYNLNAEKKRFKIYSENRDVLKKEIDQLFTLIMTLVLSGIFVFFISLYILKRKVLKPIKYLTDTITKFKNGDKDIKKIIYCNDEMGLFTEQFFQMKDKIEEDFHAMKELARTDHLTKIYNRRAFFESSERFFKLSRRKALSLSVILIDIDHFKKVNDTFGHQIGDEVLKFLVTQVKKELRDSDIFARYGGEEFIILLPDTDLEGGVKTANKIRHLIQEFPYQEKVEVAFTISCGVAQLNHDILFKDLIKRADDALYRAKEYGRNRVEVDN